MLSMYNTNLISFSSLMSQSLSGTPFSAVSVVRLWIYKLQKKESLMFHVKHLIVLCTHTHTHTHIYVRDNARRGVHNQELMDDVEAQWGIQTKHGRCKYNRLRHLYRAA